MQVTVKKILSTKMLELDSSCQLSDARLSGGKKRWKRFFLNNT
jgi:hypothetical protein